MIFFKKKSKLEELAPKPKRSLQEIVIERVQTAEGWRRQSAKKGRKAK